MVNQRSNLKDALAALQRERDALEEKLHHTEDAISALAYLTGEDGQSDLEPEARRRRAVLKRLPTSRPSLNKRAGHYDHIVYAEAV